MSGLVELTSQECWELLHGQDVARVAVVTPDGPQIIPVNFTVHDHDVFFRTTPYSVLGVHARDGVAVAVEVDHLEPATRAGWSVLILGRGDMVDNAESLREVRAGWDPQPWAEGQRYLYIRIHPHQISGRRIPAAPPTEPGHWT